MKASVSQLPPQSVPTARENGFPDLSTQGASGAFFFAPPLLPSIRATLSYLSVDLYSMDIVFHFHFYDHNNDFTPTRSLAFYVANINTAWDQLDERIAYRSEDMDAQYGAHCGVISTHPNMIGYSSSDIEGPLQDQVMDAWRTIFLNQFTGCVVSRVFDVTHLHVKDAEIFAHTQNMYEHQQAQQLRATLSANIATSAPPATTKKI